VNRRNCAAPVISANATRAAIVFRDIVIACDEVAVAPTSVSESIRAMSAANGRPSIPKAVGATHQPSWSISTPIIGRPISAAAAHVSSTRPIARPRRS